MEVHARQERDPDFFASRGLVPELEARRSAVKAASANIFSWCFVQGSADGDLEPVAPRQHAQNLARQAGSGDSRNNRAAAGGAAMTPAEQTKLINEGLNALTEQLRRVNEALELLVASLNERQAEREEHETPISRPR